MWNLSLTDVVAAKEELTGRRAAVKARYEKDMQAIEEDLKNIIALENAANIFLKSHKQEEGEAEAQDAPAPAEEAAYSLPLAGAEMIGGPNEEHPLAELQAVDPDSPDAKPMEYALERKVNRWRIR